MKIFHPHGNVKIAIVKFFSNLISTIIFIFFCLLFPKINKKYNNIIISRATYCPWKKNLKYLQIYKFISFLTLLDHPRLFTIFYFLNKIKHINADILDIGCMKGGIGIMSSMVTQNKNSRIFLFDTFSGFLEKDKLHTKKIFIYKGIDEIKKIIKELKFKNTYVLKRYFPNNIKDLDIKRIKFCHIDVNTLISTINTYNFVKKKIVTNGIIIFDDYGIVGLEKITKFIDYISQRDKKEFHFIFNYFGQCILIKK